MTGVSTITQKGQVVIPYSIREYFKLTPSSKLHFEVRNNEIVIKPLLSIKEMAGFIKAKKPLKKAEYKKIIEAAVVEKFRRKSRDNT